MRPLAAINQLFSRYGQRLFDQPRDELKDMPLDGWGSPLQPIKPMGPPSAEPRAFQIWPGQNLIFTPRPDAEYTAADLKALGTYPLARICIENVKDILTTAPMQVQLRPQPGETKKDTAKRAKGDKLLIKLNRFFERPDREHSWSEWLRLLLDDMLVGDWACVLIRRTFGGEIVELAPLAGEMIQRIIDKNGWTPLPPDPAYAQIWWGVPYVEMTTEQLVYKPRNIVRRNTLSSYLYGMSPVEQIAQEIEIGIQRLMFVLAYYTEGSIPGMMQVVPRGTPPEKIGEAMNWMNSELAGNLAKRRQIRMIQGWSENPRDENIIQTKEALLSDPFDEQHMRRIAFGIGTSPQRLAKQMNRASAEQTDDAAELEGSRPYFTFVKMFTDEIIQVKMGLVDYEIGIDSSRETDIKKQEETLTGYVKGAVMTPNEVREELDLDPDTSPQADMLGVITAAGFTTFEQQQEMHETTVDAKKNPPQPVAAPNVQAGGKPNGKPNGKPPAVSSGKPNGKPSNVAGKASSLFGYGFVSGAGASLVRGHLGVEKTSAHDTRPAVIHPGRMAPRSIVAKHRLESVLKNAFQKMSKTTVRLLRRFVGIASKATDPDVTAAEREILNAIAAEWERVADAAEGSLTDAAVAGADIGALQLDITSDDMLARINATAQEYARRRSAEMVGMRRTADGELVENPDARWAITDTTRDKLNRIITDIFEEENPTLADIEERVMQAGIFDDQRATMIARTEIANAQVNANLMAWQESGLVRTISWQTSADHDDSSGCNCTDNEDESPYAIGDVPDFPDHPNCECALVLDELVGEPEEGS
jgi:hypothetical protein